MNEQPAQHQQAHLAPVTPRVIELAKKYCMSVQDVLTVQARVCHRGAPRHGHKRRGNASLTYVSWEMMIQRCTNPKARGYQRYGGSGVKVAPEWMTFDGFLQSMGERP